MRDASPIAGPDWAAARAPSLEDVETLARAAFLELPGDFRRLCEGVVIHVADFPDDDTMRDMELESPFDILGLFRGVGLVEGGEPTSWPSGRMPNMIWLYRRPLLEYWAEHEETLGALVAHVLVHEIGHHFGLSDDDMARVEASAGP